MLFENNNNYFDLINMYPITSDDEEMKFFRGNMFDNEYEPYKNYRVEKYKPKNEQESKLVEIMKLSFAINDYNLYLDLHPNDMQMLEIYQTCNAKLLRLVSEYESKFGPLSINKADYNSFKWIESPWPWDKKDGMYV